MTDWIKTERCSYSFRTERDAVVTVEEAVTGSLEHYDHYYSGEIERVSTQVGNCIKALGAVIGYLVETATPEQRDACKQMLDATLDFKHRSTRLDKDD